MSNSSSCSPIVARLTLGPSKYIIGRQRQQSHGVTGDDRRLDGWDKRAAIAGPRSVRGSTETRSSRSSAGVMLSHFDPPCRKNDLVRLRAEPILEGGLRPRALRGR